MKSENEWLELDAKLNLLNMQIAEYKQELIKENPTLTIIQLRKKVDSKFYYEAKSLLDNQVSVN